MLSSHQIIDRINDAAITFTNAKRQARRFAEEHRDEEYKDETRRAKFHLHRYHSMISRIGMTVAHEMEHVFTGYLLRDPTAHTPPSVSYGGFGDDALGESGRYLEAGVFGGFLDMKLEVHTRMEVIAVRTYAQLFVLSSDQVNAIIRRRKSIPFRSPVSLLVFKSRMLLGLFALMRIVLLTVRQSGIFYQPTIPMGTAMKVHHGSLRPERSI